ncbi:hypothetical protein GHT06_022208 [Daphnia sinensis]|uniref:Uncharacterized protein n=1 Tax=Daphnia sinensis TaxID=1820382 RepID=A0AAD5KI40_9CRUS|nr:hypothetical protein GHT06_022208 [Daphnia sinensis]
MQSRPYVKSLEREANKTFFFSSAKQDTSFDFYFDHTANRERHKKEQPTYLPPFLPPCCTYYIPNVHGVLRIVAACAKLIDHVFKSIHIHF